MPRKTEDETPTVVTAPPRKSGPTAGDTETGKNADDKKPARKGKK